MKLNAKFVTAKATQTVDTKTKKINYVHWDIVVMRCTQLLFTNVLSLKIYIVW